MGAANPLPTNPVVVAVSEALKEVGRYLVSIGVVDTLIVVFQLFQSMINTTTGVIAINWQLIWAVTLFGVVSAGIRALDKYKHEYEKATNPDPGQPQGILPF